MISEFFVIEEDFLKIKITGSHLFADKDFHVYTDAKMLPTVSQCTWWATLHQDKIFVYSVASVGGGKVVPIYLHRMMFSAKTDWEVAFRDGNTLNCCLDNLEIIRGGVPEVPLEIPLFPLRASELISQFSGVTWDKGRGQWKARKKVNGKKKFLGYFDTDKEAAEKIENTE